MGIVDAIIPAPNNCHENIHASGGTDRRWKKEGVHKIWDGLMLPVCSGIEASLKSARRSIHLPGYDPRERPWPWLVLLQPDSNSFCTYDLHP